MIVILTWLLVAKMLKFFVLILVDSYSSKRESTGQKKKSLSPVKQSHDLFVQSSRSFYNTFDRHFFLVCNGFASALFYLLEDYQAFLWFEFWVCAVSQISAHMNNYFSLQYSKGSILILPRRVSSHVTLSFQKFQNYTEMTLFVTAQKWTLILLSPCKRPLCLCLLLEAEMHESISQAT